METDFERRPVWLILMTIFFIVFFSCKEKDNTIPANDNTNKVEPVSKAEDLHAYPGRNRIKLSWVVPDSDIDKAVVYWKNKDSLAVPYAGKDTMQTIISHLNEDSYLFSVVLYDKKGNLSKKAEIYRKVYGDNYIKTLKPRVVKEALYFKGDVEINWDSPYPNSIGTQIGYKDQSDHQRQVFISKSVNKDTLKNYMPGTSFEYRTAFLPVKEALDTFYSQYKFIGKNSTFTNPLVKNAPDPWVIRKGNMYYFTHTSVNKIVLYATKKMSELGNVTPVTIWTPPSATDHSTNIWAPELHYLQGKWYIYFTADGTGHGHRMFVLENSSSNPVTGTWVYKGQLTPSPDDWAIDGTILETDHQLYFVWSGFSGDGTNVQHIYISKMSNPWTLEGSRVLLSSPVYNWETYGGKVNEGPEILKNKKGDIFLIYSASQCATDDYCLGMLSLKPNGNPLVPEDWTKSPEPVFVSQSSAYGPGHCSFFISPDNTENWIVYHANPQPGQGCGAHRSARMQSFTWNSDGTPDFGKPVAIGRPVKTPSGEF